MTTVEYGSSVNLEEIHGQLTGRVALALIGVGGLLILVTWPIVSLSSVGVTPLAVVPLATLLVGLGLGVLMALSTIVTIPIVIAFFLTQRTFIEGISLTGLKG